MTRFDIRVLGREAMPALPKADTTPSPAPSATARPAAGGSSDVASDVSVETDGMAVIVVNYGSHELIEANFGAIGFAGLGLRLIVVDNFTDAAEVHAITRVVDRHGWTLLQSKTNVGFGAAVNLAADFAAASGCTGLLFVNPDAVVGVDVLVALRLQLLADPDAAVSPRIQTPRGRIEYQGSQVRLSDGRIRGLGPAVAGNAGMRVDGQVPGQLSGPVQGWLSGACLAISTSLFERAARFDESYFLYWEDVDLSRRIEQAGGTLVVRNDLEVLHDEGGTQRKSNAPVRPNAYYYFNCRNRLAFAARNLDRPAILRWILATPRESWQILLRGGRRQLLRSPKPTIAALHGSWDGLRVAVRALVRGRVRPTTGSPVLFAHPGAELYGSDRMLLESIAGLAATGSDVTVVVPGPGALVDEILALGVRVEFCSMLVLRKTALNPVGFLRLFGDLVRGLIPGIRLILRRGRGGVYVNTVTIPSWLILARLLRRPVICHVHEAESSAPRLVRRLMALPALCAEQVIVNSQYSFGVLVESLPRLRSRTTVVYNGVVGPTELIAPREQLLGRIKLLYLGRLSPRKGPSVALAAVQELVARGVDVQLELLGSVFPGYEWFVDQLRAEADTPALRGRINFLGFENDIWPRLAAADIVLVPSVVDEPFGNTAVEALLAGRPAIVSATSGLREAAADYSTALLVEPNDPVAIADTVTRIAADWASYGRLAAIEAAQAKERHSPARYRDEVVGAVQEARRRR